MDYYEILGVSKNATPEEIKKAYRKKAIEHHPDKGGDENKFKEAAQAYETLSDDGKRKHYDMFGDNPNQGGFGGGNPFEDIFSSFFSGGGGNPFGGNPFGSGSQQRQPRGNALRVNISVDLMEIITGVQKKVKYNRQVTCKTCKGAGGLDVKKCTSCSGTGQKVHNMKTPIGVMQQISECQVCDGTGQTVNIKCNECKGSGTISQEEIVDVNLPKGVYSGMELKMDGYGNHVKNGTPGALHILVSEIPHPKFKREGVDLYCDEYISIPDAVLGTSIDLQTLTGDLNITIKPGCESGKVFKYDNMGIPMIGQNGKGSLFVKVNVEIPKKVSAAEKKIYESLRNHI